jgi:hypothetical protein
MDCCTTFLFFQMEEKKPEKKIEENQFKRIYDVSVVVRSLGRGRGAGAGAWAGGGGGREGRLAGLASLGPLGQSSLDRRRRRLLGWLLHDRLRQRCHRRRWTWW